MDMNSLELQVDGVTRTFAEWTSHFVDSYYPEIGRHCYRVPAQHFNKQKLSKDGSSEQLLLHPPDASAAAGDLAHTVVLEKLEELSHQLKTRDSQPLFIISSVEYDNYLAKLNRSLPKRRHPQKDHSDSKAKKKRMSSKNVFCSETSEESVEDTTEKPEPEAKQSFVLPPRPADKGKQRGEIDVLLLHEKCGVGLVEVKSTGHPDPTWTPTEEALLSAINNTVTKATKQLTDGSDMLRYLMPDLHIPQIRMIIALPYVTKHQLSKAVSIGSSEVLFLCKDDFLPSAPSRNEALPVEQKTSPENTTQDVHGDSSLLSWWDNLMSEVGDTGTLSLDAVRTIVGRICGLMSIVSVWTKSKPRVEVRTLAQAASEVGSRVSDIILLPRQADLLAHSPLRLWLTGPMGSGKTLMLQLKGRQWVKEGRRVVVINVRTTARGRPIGHILEEAIRRASEGNSGCGTVDRHDVALDDFSIEALEKELNTVGSTDKICFVVDEVLSDMSVIAKKLMNRYPSSPIWCVASYAAPVPATFQQYRLGAVLRNPPSVQLLLKELDLNSKHRDVYTTRSAARGFACDGPPVIFIEHSKHDSDVRHLDCLQCANELADIFQNVLGLELCPPGSQQDSDPSQSNRRSFKRQKFKTANAASLSFRDVLILSGLPFATYRHIADYHWEPHIPEVLQYMIYMGTSRFLSGLKQRGVPVKVAVDNTMKEIAFPTKNEVIITDFMGAHSLERKVVVFLRAGLPLTQEEVQKHLCRYQTMKASTIPHQPETKTSSNPDDTSSDKQQPETETLSKELLLFASLMYEVRDGLYPELPTTFSSLDAKIIVQILLGNMMVAGTQSFMQGKERPKSSHRSPSSAIETIPTKLRMGLEVRGNLPMLTSESRKGIEATEEEDRCCESVIGADSVFLAPDVTEDVEKRQNEVNRIQRAMECLSEDDKDWEFFAASRCLSQFISILP